MKFHRLLPRPGRELAKWCVRTGARLRLTRGSLSFQEAERWANRLRQWPGIFGDLPHHRVVTLDGGLLMDLGIVDVVERHLRTVGFWDRPVRRVLERILRPGDVFVDLGAHVGYFTLVASRLVGPSGLVVAVEPSQRALKKLTRNLQLNGCSNVLLLSVAATDRCERRSLTLAHWSNIGASAILPNPDGDRLTEPVLGCPLDVLFARSELRPRAVKLDLEGFELYALRGARQWISESAPYIVCELTPVFLQRHGQSAHDLIEFMRVLGYTGSRASEDADGRLALLPLKGEDLSENEQLDVLFLPACAPEADLGTVSGPVVPVRRFVTMPSAGGR